MRRVSQFNRPRRIWNKSKQTCRGRSGSTAAAELQLYFQVVPADQEPFRPGSPFEGRNKGTAFTASAIAVKRRTLRLTTSLASEDARLRRFRRDARPGNRSLHMPEQVAALVELVDREGAGE